jgi:luciferase-like monooxygenase
MSSPRLVCDAVEGRVLDEPDVPALRAAAIGAEGEGASAIFLTDGALGDAISLASALSAITSTILIGVLVDFHRPHRHPAIVARDMTTLDLLLKGRAVLALQGPFDDVIAEAAALCRDMWQNGTAHSTGPLFPVADAVNRPGPFTTSSPRIALQTSADDKPTPALLELADFLLIPLSPGVCQMLEA